MQLFNSVALNMLTTCRGRLCQIRGPRLCLYGAGHCRARDQVWQLSVKELDGNNV